MVSSSSIFVVIFLVQACIFLVWEGAIFVVLKLQYMELGYSIWALWNLCRKLSGRNFGTAKLENNGWASMEAFFLSWFLHLIAKLSDHICLAFCWNHMIICSFWHWPFVIYIMLYTAVSYTHLTLPTNLVV